MSGKKWGCRTYYNVNPFISVSWHDTILTIPVPPFVLPTKAIHLDFSVVQGLWIGAFLSNGRQNKVSADTLYFVGRMSDAGPFIPHISFPPSAMNIMTTIFGSSMSLFGTSGVTIRCFNPIWQKQDCDLSLSPFGPVPFSLNLACHDPFSAPTDIVIVWGSIYAGMGLGDFLAALADFAMGLACEVGMRWLGRKLGPIFNEGASMLFGKLSGGGSAAARRGSAAAANVARREAAHEAADAAVDAAGDAARRETTHEAADAVGDAAGDGANVARRETTHEAADAAGDATGDAETSLRRQSSAQADARSNFSDVEYKSLYYVKMVTELEGIEDIMGMYYRRGKLSKSFNAEVADVAANAKKPLKKGLLKNMKDAQSTQYDEFLDGIVSGGAEFRSKARQEARERAHSHIKKIQKKGPDAEAAEVALHGEIADRLKLANHFFDRIDAKQRGAVMHDLWYKQTFRLLVGRIFLRNFNLIPLPLPGGNNTSRLLPIGVRRRFADRMSGRMLSFLNDSNAGSQGDNSGYWNDAYVTNAGTHEDDYWYQGKGGTISTNANTQSTATSASTGRTV